MKFLSSASVLLFSVALRHLSQVKAWSGVDEGVERLDGRLGFDDETDNTDDAFDILVEKRLRNLSSGSGSGSSSSSSSSSSDDDNNKNYKYRNYNYNGNSAYSGYNNNYNSGSSAYNSGSSSYNSGSSSYNSGSSYNSATGGYSDSSAYSKSNSSQGSSFKTYLFLACGFGLLVAGAIYGPTVKRRIVETALELDEDERQRKRSTRPSSKNKPREPLFKRPSRRKDYYEEETTVGSTQDYTEAGDGFDPVAPYHGPPVYATDQYYPAGAAPYDSGNGSQYYANAPGPYGAGEQYYGDDYGADNQYYHQDNVMPDYPGYR